MSYNDEQVRSKLNTLHDTQESIEQVGQWVLFHRRHAAHTVSLWASYLESAPPAKRLILVYLANEVVQVSLAKKKPDFADAFTPVIPQAMATAYTRAGVDVQARIRRVVKIWADRNTFTPSTIEAIFARLNDIDKSRSGPKMALGGSLADASAASAKTVPAELAKLAPLQTASTSAARNASSVSTAATTAYDSTPADAADANLPAHSAHLSKTLRALSSAADAVQASLTARTSLMNELQALLDKCSETQKSDEALLAELTAKKSSLEDRKRKAEDDILASGIPRPALGADGEEVERPEMEALTPPPVEEFTPPPDDLPPTATTTVNGTATGIHEGKGDGSTTPPGAPSEFARSIATPTNAGESRDPRRRPPAASAALPTTTLPGVAPPTKKRKVEDADEGFGGVEGLDAETVGLL